MMIPTIHLTGTSKEELLEQNIEAMRTVRIAIYQEQGQKRSLPTRR
ncbi:MAG: hypothetical protein WC460_06695 [Patescibacteria group bacterium]